MPVVLDPFASVAPEHFDLDQVRRDLEALPELTEGFNLVRPASLTRFGLTRMSWSQERRFWKYIKPADMGYDSRFGPCWIWQGGLHDEGYGRFYLGMDPKVDGLKIWSYPHRISFEHFIGIPKPGYVIDHKCNVKTCCNPVHLQAVTNQENLILANQRRDWKRRNQYSKE